VRLFLRQFQREFNKDIQDVDPEVLAQLDAYSWPGNVRELRNAVERAVLLAEGTVLRCGDLRIVPGRREEPETVHLPDAGLHFEDVERSLVLQALERSGWNKAGAARLLGMPRDWLRYRMEKFDLHPADENGLRDYSRPSRE